MSGGIARLSEVDGLGSPDESVRERLVFLESMGYVVNPENFGGDLTLTHRGIGQGVTELHRLAERYHVSELGMRMALSDAVTEGLPGEQPG